MDLAERKGDSKTKEMIIYSVTLKSQGHCEFQLEQ